MASKLPDVEMLVQQLEAAVHSLNSASPLEQLLEAVKVLDHLRAIEQGHSELLQPFIERRAREAARLLAFLQPQIERLLNELFGLKTEIDPLQQRYDSVKAGIKEILRSQTQTKVVFPMPDFGGSLLAYEQSSVSLPPAGSRERAELEDMLRKNPQYWIEASAITGKRLKALCDRLDGRQLQEGRTFSSYLRSNRDFVLRPSSPQFGGSEA